MAKKVDYPRLVRLEDICPTLDRQKFDIFKAFFDETGIKPLLCVIPENRDPKELRICKDPGLSCQEFLIETVPGT